MLTMLAFALANLAVNSFWPMGASVNLSFFMRPENAFELAAFVLLLAIVAAIMLTLRHREGLKAQDVFEQVSVKAEDRITLVSMDAESE